VGEECTRQIGGLAIEWLAAVKAIYRRDDGNVIGADSPDKPFDLYERWHHLRGTGGPMQQPL
jgi:hypothetical protein